MIAGRLSSILLFVLSLGFLVCAAPSSPMVRAVGHRRDSGSLPQLTMLEGMTRKQLDSCMRVKTTDEANPIIAALVSNLEKTAQSLSESGKAELNESAKSDVAVRGASCTTLAVKILLKLSQNLGCDAVAPYYAQVDLALKGLFGAIDTCAPETVSLVAPKIKDVKIEAILRNKMGETAKVLGLTV